MFGLWLCRFLQALLCTCAQPPPPDFTSTVIRHCLESGLKWFLLINYLFAAYALFSLVCNGVMRFALSRAGSFADAENDGESQSSQKGPASDCYKEEQRREEEGNCSRRRRRNSRGSHSSRTFADDAQYCADDGDKNKQSGHNHHKCHNADGSHCGKVRSEHQHSESAVKPTQDRDKRIPPAEDSAMISAGDSSTLAHRVMPTVDSCRRALYAANAPRLVETAKTKVYEMFAKKHTQSSPGRGARKVVRRSKGTSSSREKIQVEFNVKKRLGKKYSSAAGGIQSKSCTKCGKCLDARRRKCAKASTDGSRQFGFARHKTSSANILTIDD